MIAPNLVLKYMIDGDSKVHVRGAMRIRVDGCGALTVYAEGGASESVSLNCLKSLSIHSIQDTTPYVSSVIQ